MSNNAARAAKPTKEIFDAFNSSSTGHQRAENRLSGSTAWRDSRHHKLRQQLRGGAGGGKRVSDTIGAGSDQSGKQVEQGNTVVGWSTSKGQAVVQDALKTAKAVERPSKRAKLNEGAPDLYNAAVAAAPAPKDNARSIQTAGASSPSSFLSPIDPNSSISISPLPTTPEDAESEVTDKPKPQIFAGLNFYINGSTAPAVSDHKVKRMLSEHGANISIALGRRTVTHVILARPNSSGGSGGGLSGGKIQKEISRKGGKAVKYVTVDWVLQSVKAGKCLQESSFEALRFAPKNTGSLANMFGDRRKTPLGTAGKDDG